MLAVKAHRGARGLSDRALDSRARGLGFESHHRRVVSLSKTRYSPKVLLIPRKLWLHPDVTEKLLTETLSHNRNKQNQVNLHICAVLQGLSLLACKPESVGT